MNGGDALYLCHWMRESGLAGLFPSLRDMVYVGLSAGSMVLTPRIGNESADWQPPSGDDWQVARNDLWMAAGFYNTGLIGYHTPSIVRSYFRAKCCQG